MSSETGIIGYCRACGKPLVEGAATTSDGILYCAEHAPAVHQAETLSEPPLLPQPPSPYTAPHTAPPPLPKPDSHSSPPLAFVLGFIPGVGAVYNGQYAKGLMHVVIFGSIISILSSGAARGFEPLFGMMIPTFVFYMAFEAYHTAKKRRDGEAVDEFSGLARTAGTHSRFPVAASSASGMRCVSGRWSSPMSPSRSAPAALKYLNAVQRKPWALPHQCSIFSATRFDSPYGLIGS